MEKWTKESAGQWSNSTPLITASVVLNRRAARWFVVVSGRDTFETYPASKNLNAAKAFATRLARRALRAAAEML